MIRRPPRSTLDRSSAASDVYKRQEEVVVKYRGPIVFLSGVLAALAVGWFLFPAVLYLSLIHISEPTRPY